MSSDRHATEGTTLATDRNGPRIPPDPRIGDRIAERFTLVQMLGAGAHGVVYEAEDQSSSGRPVALKILTRLDPDELYRFKREFRLLADVSDEHLVTLHELFIDDTGAFFTMELVRGTDFLSYVRGDDDERLDVERLRDALRQLCQGLVALHGFGKLHRDLKPSNVLVAEGGHVSVADFGLAEELATLAKHRDLVGTPSYMSPEQAAGQTLTPASDWYSVGVMLYEALTGHVPFSGSFGKHMLIAKQGPPPPPPSSLVAGLPEDLDDLCTQLLRRDAHTRPAGPAILEQLGRRPDAASSRPASPAAFGRDQELVRLHRAFAMVIEPVEGRAAVMLMRGHSGAGKTMLLDTFVAELRGAVVLRGRCYERESVPYKGLDALVDELRGHLHRERRSWGPLLPVPGVAALTQLFPVLGDVEGVGNVLTGVVEDPAERRRQAVSALREILTQLSRRAPLVLVLDDLQWCDADTVAILVALLRPRSRPNMLLLASFRDEETGPTSAPAVIQAELEALGDELVFDTMAVEPLPPAAARELAFHLLGERHDAAPLADAIVAEAGGSPLFIAELARHAESGRVPATGEGLTLDGVIRARVAELPIAAQRLLELSAIAAGPIGQGVLAAAAGIEGSAEVLALLRTRCLLRTHGARPVDPVEPFHDRIGTAVVSGLDGESRRLGHARLAEQLEQVGADPETVAAHLLGAGEPGRAGNYVARAAADAAAALAFTRAARLYARALELVPSRSEQQPLREQRAAVLAHDGRSAEAAVAYLEACRDAEPPRVLALQRHAAEQWLRSGRTREGSRQLRGVLVALGLPEPPDPRRALASFVWLRAKIRVRGTGFVECPEAEVDPRLLLRIDTTWTAAIGLQQANVMIGQYFQAQHLLLALEAGEPHRVARALGVEAMYAAAAGTSGAAQVDDLVERVLGLARRLDDPRARATAHLAAGAGALYRGRFVDARAPLELAESLFRSQCTNVAWEVSMVRTFLHMVLYHLGDMTGLEQAMKSALDDATARDDMHTGLMIRVAFGPMPALARGDLPRARAILAECEAQWPSQLQTSTYGFVRLLTRARLDRYARRPEAAWRAFEEQWPEVVRSLMLTKQPLRTYLLHDRACTMLWVAWSSGPVRRFSMLRKAQHDARALARQGTRWAAALGSSIDAVISHARGRRQHALARALEAERGLEELGMCVFAAGMKKRRGELLGGGAGAALIEQADTRLREAGVIATDAMTDMLMPPVLGW